MENKKAIVIKNLTKTFILHQQGGIKIEALKNVSLNINYGECVVINGPSGAGKSSLLKCIYRNYLPDSGSIRIGSIEMVTAELREIIRMRQSTIGYVSQFLRVIPRLSALNVVAEPLIEDGIGEDAAYGRAKEMLKMLNIPERLWDIAPATFSGGEQQRVNIARSFIMKKPILLLDEPTASLDRANREVVVSLIERAKKDNTAILGVFHDEQFRNKVADRSYNLGQ